MRQPQTGFPHTCRMSHSTDPGLHRSGTAAMRLRNSAHTCRDTHGTVGCVCLGHRRRRMGICGRLGKGTGGLISPVWIGEEAMRCARLLTGIADESLLVRQIDVLGQSESRLRPGQQRSRGDSDVYTVRMLHVARSRSERSSSTGPSAPKRAKPDRSLAGRRSRHILFQRPMTNQHRARHRPVKGSHVTV